jgi:hypothetical protein
MVNMISLENLSLVVVVISFLVLAEGLSKLKEIRDLHT